MGNLCPRGYGRTSFRLFESLQMGLIPIYIFSDVPWVPYPRLFDRVAFVTELDGLTALLLRLRNMSSNAVAQMEQTISKLRKSHFTFGGVVRHISHFMMRGGDDSDLSCVKLPST